MRILHMPILAAAFASHCALGIVLPVCEVVERPQKNVSTYPGRVVPIAQVDVTPQVSGEILEVCFANGAEVKDPGKCSVPRPGSPIPSTQRTQTW